MEDDSRITISPLPSRALSRVEICEPQGIGHPDRICDGVPEALSRALSAAYRKAYGAVQHHKVNKTLLVDGQSAPRGDVALAGAAAGATAIWQASSLIV